jgi:hypothetical protein
MLNVVNTMTKTIPKSSPFFGWFVGYPQVWYVYDGLWHGVSHISWFIVG